jgi:hypothetical protein
MTKVTQSLNPTKLKRWKNALKKAASVNRFIRKGYTVLDSELESGTLIKAELFSLQIDSEGISSLGMKSGNAFYCYGDNDIEMDNGIMHTSLKDFTNGSISAIKVYQEIAI